MGLSDPSPGPQRLDRTASPSTSSIDSATDSRERSVKGESVLQRVQNVAGNSQCGDCGQPDPRWACSQQASSITCRGEDRRRGATGGSRMHGRSGPERGGWKRLRQPLGQKVMRAQRPP